jgi:hypothetical protein
MKKWKKKIVRIIFWRFYRDVVDVVESNMDWRKIDELQLECGHKFWQETGGGTRVRFCDACFFEWCKGIGAVTQYKDGGFSRGGKVFFWVTRWMGRREGENG